MDSTVAVNPSVEEDERLTSGSRMMERRRRTVRRLGSVNDERERGWPPGVGDAQHGSATGRR
jgi:hypothetical protein